MKTRWLPLAAVLGGMALYSLFMGAVCWAKYTNFAYTDFDLAVHAQSIWNITQGSGDCSILGIPFLGNHMVLILYLVAPLYAIFPSAFLLLLLQCMILSLGALAVYLFARLRFSTIWAVAFSFLYLLYPPLLYMNLYEFHPVCFATTFLLFAMYFHEIRAFRSHLIFLVLAMLCQENIALIVLFFAPYSWSRGLRGRWIWTPFLMGLITFTVTIFFIMPRLNQGVILFSSLYQHLGNSPADAIGNMLQHPVTTLQTIFSPEKMAFLGTLLIPLAFLSLLEPRALIPLLPILAQRLLSARPSEHMITFHYQAEFIPFLFAATILGASHLQHVQKEALIRIISLVLPVTLAGSLLLSGVPATLAKAWNPAPLNPYTVRKRAEIIRAIPPDASVVCTFQFLAPLANRRALHSLHHIYYGYYTLSTRPYPTPPQPDFLILDPSDLMTFSMFYTPSGYTNLQRLMSTGHWNLMENLDGLLVFSRADTGTFSMTNLISWVPSPSNATSITTQKVQLLHHEFGPLEKDNNIPLTLYWQTADQTPSDFFLWLLLYDKEQLLDAAVLFPGNRIAPPQSWPTNSIVTDRHRLHLSHPPSTPDSLSIRAEISHWPP